MVGVLRKVNLFTKINEDGKFHITLNTDIDVNCRLGYKDMNLIGEDNFILFMTNLKGVVNFDPFLPYYEINCHYIPTFYYFMPNTFMKKNIESLNLKYTISYKNDTNKNLLVLKAQNSNPSEICLFKIKSALTVHQNNPFESNCGNSKQSSFCYAPCDNIELKLEQPTEIVTVLIQRRHDDIYSDVDGYSQTSIGNIN